MKKHELYEEFCNAMENTENVTVQRECQSLIDACQIYYSYYYQYKKMINIGNSFEQIYKINPTAKEKMKAKANKLGFGDRYILSFLYQDNIVEPETVQDKKNHGIDDSQMKEEQTSSSYNATMKTVLSRKKEEFLEDYEYLADYYSVIERYQALLNLRIKKGKKDIDEVLFPSDIQCDKMVQAIGIYQRSRKFKSRTADESFEAVLSPKYINELIAVINSPQASAISLFISPIRSQLAEDVNKNTFEIDSKSWQDKYAKIFKMTIPKLRKAINEQIEIYKEISDEYNEIRRAIKRQTDL